MRHVHGRQGIRQIGSILRHWFGARSPLAVGLMCGTLASLLCLAVSSIFLARDRADILRQGTRDLTAISLPAAGFVARGLVTLNLAVSQATGEFARGHLDLAGVYLRLRQQAEQIDQLEALRGVACIDADGIIRYTGDVTRVGVNVSDSGYFARQREERTTGMMVGTPVTLEFAPEQEIVPVSWPLRDEHGDFAGVIAVGASWRLYAQIFASLTNEPEQIVSLVDEAGRLYALDDRHWPDQNQPPPRPPFLSRETGSHPSYRSGDYLVARADVQGFGLHVVTGVRVDVILKPWWIRVGLGAGLIVVIGLVTGLLTGMLHRTMKALRAAAVAAEAAAAEARIAQGLAEAGERSKTQFLAVMSHEIRTPMTGVLGMADLLAAEPLPERQHSYVRTIRTSGEHLMSVINDILDFSRIEAGGLVLEEIDFAVADLIEQVRSIMAPQAVDRGLSLQFELDESAPQYVSGDPTRLRQVLVNLIGNALKFTSMGSVWVRVSATASQNKARLRFAVQDSGIGIPRDRQADLFNAFTQADLSTTRKYGGSGLGLAICRRLVHAMGGTIGVDSEPGKGSLFWFELVLPVRTAAPPTETASLAERRAAPLRVLVAEDVAVNRDLILAGLSRYGHEVVLAQNGSEAVEQVAHHEFDVVLMDVQMPEMDGIEATRRIRAMPKPAGAIPIFALTANVMEAERRRCLEAGMSRLLSKPIMWGELHAALHDIKRSAPELVAAEAAAATVPEAVTAPLLDCERIDGLKKMAGPVKLAQFLNNAMESAETLLAEIEALREQPAELALPAHRLAGTAPSFGLIRIGALARVVEERALNGDVALDLLHDLSVAVAATRSALKDGYLPDPT
jgi:signal transduction histidine kinase/CheY-like chemotaxis protein/HPt (histidine-containing phosphotransfer) domain-containing protein